MSDVETDPVVIVGAGLAGLACAVRLAEKGVNFLLLEQSDRPGGRVKTDVVDGFRLDRGFQVYLTGYPEAGQLLDLEALDLREFEPGALVRYQGEFERLMDVFRRPGAVFSTTFSRLGSLKDKVLVGLLRLKLARRSEERMAEEKVTTEEFLRDFGFSEAFVNGFFRAFYGGIFLERGLETAAGFFQFTFQMFSKGGTAVPALGMEEIPKQLAARLPAGKVRCECEVASVKEGKVTLKSGEEIQAKKVVLAVEGSGVGSLLDGEADREPMAWRETRAYWFAAKKAPVNEPIIVLNGVSTGLVNNLAEMSAVSERYAPEGEVLLCLSVVGPELEHESVEKVREECQTWYGTEVEEWRHLRTDRIRKALPVLEPEKGVGHQGLVEVREGGKVVICGDHVASPSIEGAIRSGLRAAAVVLD